jgi:ATP-binding cassette subfamily B protein
MRMIRHWLTTGTSTATIVGQMLTLSWRTQPFYLIALLCIQVLQGLVPLATAWVMKGLFDLLAQSLLGHSSTPFIQNLIALLIAQAVITVFSLLLAPTNQYFYSELGRRLTLHIKSSAYRKVNSFAGLTYFEDPDFHDTFQVVAANSQLAPQDALSILSSFAQGIIILASFLGVLITLSPLLTGIVFLAVVPQFYLQSRYNRMRFTMTMNNSPKERQSAYYGQVLTWASYAKEVRLFNLGDYFLRNFIDTTRAIYQAQHEQQWRELRGQLILSFLSSGIATGTFLVVIIQAFSGRLSLGDIVLYTSAVSSVQNALALITYAITRMHNSLLFFTQYNQLLNLDQPLHISCSPRQVPPLTTGITLRDVSFRYNEEHPWTLRHVDIFLPANRCLALVGLNGAGKTTLVKLLTRLYDPTEGQILWNDIDIREFDPHEFRQHISTIFQDFVRYDLSIQENIGLGNIAQIENDADVKKAALTAGIHERIESLPQGYQTILSLRLAQKKQGVDFSGGEWQKVALARMFMRAADVLMLDEPTAVLDAQAEYELYQHFKQLMHGKTCLLITHRFSSVRMADQIAVLEDGHIIEYGTHDELLAQVGTYEKLYSMQAESYR